MRGDRRKFFGIRRRSQYFGYRRKERQVHAGRAIGDKGHEFPDLLGGETHDRCNQPYQYFSDAPDRSLGGPAPHGIWSECVEPVLQNVKIDGAKVYRAKLIYLVVEDRKSTRLNSSHRTIYTLSLHDALPI